MCILGCPNLDRNLQRTGEVAEEENMKSILPPCLNTTETVTKKDKCFGGFLWHKFTTRH